MKAVRLPREGVLVYKRRSPSDVPLAHPDTALDKLHQQTTFCDALLFVDLRHSNEQRKAIPVKFLRLLVSSCPIYRRAARPITLRS